MKTISCKQHGEKNIHFMCWHLQKTPAQKWHLDPLRMAGTPSAWCTQCQLLTNSSRVKDWKTFMNAARVICSDCFQQEKAKATSVAYVFGKGMEK